MVLFPVIAGLLLLALLAELVLLLRAAGGDVLRRRRPGLHHPTVRAVIVLTLIEIALVLAWALLLKPHL